MGRKLTLQIKIYPTRKVMKREKKRMNEIGMRSLHTEFIDNDESKGFKVTFVNDIDDPNNSEENKTIRLQERLQELLVESIEKDIITWDEYKMLLRLERGLELKQSTIDKLIVIKQGGFNGIIQRLKNLFGL